MPEPAWPSRPIVAAVGLGAEREPELVEVLEAGGVLVVGARCLSADQVQAAAAARHVEAALLGAGLYRLDPGVLERLRLPVVLLTDEPHAGRWPRRRGLVVLPLEADAAQVRAALAEALRGRTSEPLPLVRPRPGSTPPVERAGGGRGQLVWVTKYLGLLADTVRKQNVTADQLTIHANRGTSMASKPVALLLADLGVTKSHSRPHCSNDNPYSEAQFKTLKYRPEFPQRFGSIEHARASCQRYFRWYNHEHRHSGLGFHTRPMSTSDGLEPCRSSVRAFSRLPTPLTPNASCASSLSRRCYQDQPGSTNRRRSR